MKNRLNEMGIFYSRIKRLLVIMRISALLILLAVFSSTAGVGLPASSLSETNQQQNTVTGKVLDETGQPLPGVTVIKKGTTEGTVTNTEGVYSLSNVSSGTTLLFSFVGMLSQDIVFEGQASIDVTLQMDAIGIEEVIAIGYGTVKKQDLTGSVGSVASSKLESRGSADAMEALQGQLAGVNISRSSGRANVGFDMVIRGQN